MFVLRVLDSSRLTDILRWLWGNNVNIEQDDTGTRIAVLSDAESFMQKTSDYLSANTIPYEIFNGNGTLIRDVRSYDRSPSIFKSNSPLHTYL